MVQAWESRVTDSQLIWYMHGWERGASFVNQFLCLVERSIAFLGFFSPIVLFYGFSMTLKLLCFLVCFLFLRRSIVRTLVIKNLFITLRRKCWCVVGVTLPCLFTVLIELLILHQLVVSDSRIFKKRGKKLATVKSLQSWWRADVRNFSFRNSSQWPIYRFQLSW